MLMLTDRALTGLCVAKTLLTFVINGLHCEVDVANVIAFACYS